MLGIWSNKAADPCFSQEWNMNLTCISSQLDGILFLCNSECLSKRNEGNSYVTWITKLTTLSIGRSNLIFKSCPMSLYALLLWSFGKHTHTHKLTCELQHLFEPLVHLADVWVWHQKTPWSPLWMCRCYKVNTNPVQAGFDSSLKFFHWEHLPQRQDVLVWNSSLVAKWKHICRIFFLKSKAFFSSQKANKVKLLCNIQATQLVTLNECVLKFIRSDAVKINNTAHREEWFLLSGFPILAILFQIGF